MLYRFVPQLIAEVGMDAILEHLIKELGEEQVKQFVTGAVIEATMIYAVSELTNTPINWNEFAVDVIIGGLRNTKWIAADMQAWAACIQGINLNSLQKLFSNPVNEDIIITLLTLSAECLIPMVFEKAFGNKSSDLFLTTQRSATTGFVGFFNKLNISKKTQADIMVMVRGLDDLMSKKGGKWNEQIRHLITTENGSRAFDVLRRANFNIGTLSSRNFERLTNIVSKFDDNAVKSLDVLFRGTRDVNRMLIYLEKSGSTVAQYTKCIDDVIDNKLFNGTITLSGGKTMNKIDFLLNYTDDLTEYYHKATDGKLSFLKLDPGTKQGALIVIDSYSKAIISADCRILTGVTTEYIEEFNLESIKDEN